MKQFLKTILVALFVSIAAFGYSQDVNVLLKEAENLEIKLNEADALTKYKEVLLVDPNNVKALCKATILTSRAGNRLTDKKEKKLYYESALAFAQRAITAGSNDADANYVMAIASGKMADVEPDAKKVVAYVKDVKIYADKALAINPNHGKAYYALGKWNIDLVNLSGIKKGAVNMFYGGMPDVSLEKAIEYMEKCKTLEPYFMLNYFELAKVYRQDEKPTKAMEVLYKLVKLPLRTADDANMKAEAQKMLQGEL